MHVSSQYRLILEETGLVRSFTRQHFEKLNLLLSVALVVLGSAFHSAINLSNHRNLIKGATYLLQSGLFKKLVISFVKGLVYFYLVFSYVNDAT
jgi:hypothetical protein